MQNTPTSKKRLNQKSYLITMTFTLPAFIAANSYGRTLESQPDEFMQSFSGIARIVALILGVFIVVWTIKRLHDLGRNGWFALLLLPPLTIFLLVYALFAPSKDENRWGASSQQWSFFGIRLKGTWRIITAIIVGIFMIYLAGLFLTFLLA